MTIGENIKKLRLKKRLSQEGLGEILGVSAQAVSKWELGITSPDISLLPEVAECFGVTIDSLFEDFQTRKYPGYGSERGELFAIYTSNNGTEDDFKRAVESYNEVILSGKATTEDYIKYGILHKVRAFRDIEVAIYYYRRAIMEGNDNRDLEWMAAHQTLTNLLVEIGRTEEAVAEQRKWCDIEPDSAWAHIAYSYALEKADRLEDALEEIEIALKINPNDMNVLTSAGDMCVKLGRYDEAVGYWDRIPKDSTSISHLFSKAEMYASIGENENAINQYEEILEWLKERGYNIELEGEYPRKRIKELIL